MRERFDRVLRAREMATKAHAGQKYGEHPYLYHIEQVVSLVSPFGGVAQIVAYLHDTLEDTDLTFGKIADTFGSTVALCVGAVTDPEGPNRKARKAALHERLSEIRLGDEEELALLVKAADRLANVRASAKEGQKGLLDMYGREHQEFRAAVFRAGFNEDLIFETDRLLAV